ncbi:MAG: hypothetical protein AAF517_28265 [Planctomycetota bacterium]
MYRELDSTRIIETNRRLEQRVAERVPDSGLAKVCRELVVVAMQSKDRCDKIRDGHAGLRIAVGFLILLIIGGLTATFFSLKSSDQAMDFATFVQLFEPGLNSLVLIGAAIIFLITGETRIKRNRAIKALGELRAVAHVIDMHQLTKDPERVRQSGFNTPSSPDVRLNEFQLTRYLDYCTEMLSILGKISALYAQNFDDPAVITAVNEVESLTTGLSRKIWQKIMILHLDGGSAEPKQEKS